jgi:phage-related protein
MTLDRIPSDFLRSIKGVSGLYEIRIEDNSNIYRFFCCFDQGNLVVLFNAFQKKTQKTPKDEIDKAKLS